jgi:hypothetical protein
MQITSSPYVTSYEYADLHQLTTIWLQPEVNLKEYKSEFILLLIWFVFQGIIKLQIHLFGMKEPVCIIFILGDLNIFQLCVKPTNSTIPA